MFNPVAKIAIAAAAVLGSMSIASAASADPGGSYIISNNTSVQVDKVAETFGSGYFTRFPKLISPRSVSYDSFAYQRNGGPVFVGTTMWINKDNKFGCSFTTVITYSSYSGKYSFTFSSAKQGGPASTATCSITAARDVYSGSFTAYPVIGGF